VVRGPSPDDAVSSSHREAPAISEDPAADNTDLYAFRSPDRPNMLTIVANWIPAEDPAAGPMYYRFSSKARYNIKIDRNGDAKADVVYRFRFRNLRSPLFLANTVQRYTVQRVAGGRATIVARGMTPPNNIGPRTNQTFYGSADHGTIANERIFDLAGGGRVFAGQREDAFFGDIGAIFDLVGFRRGTGNMGGGKDFFAGYAVHAVALQIPIAQLDDRDHIVGVWATTDRRQLSVRVTRGSGNVGGGKSGPALTGRAGRATVSKRWVQVSRLGNPLVNEVIIPTTRKDEWNRGNPAGEAKFLKFYREPLLAAAINQFYPGVVNAPEKDRDDLVAVFLTGVPGLNYTGRKLADMLRINLSILPSANPSRLGVFGGDNAGYPNGRRLEDDVIDIAERAVAGKLKGNPNADALGDGVDANDAAALSVFPYENHPLSGFVNSKGNCAAGLEEVSGQVATCP
ncbi:MAG: DUF4331 domain-containing protein, partial [Actinomycetota bacterium]|nr:DUF4331 domain-containing protein [Actinomycetota bacterium]